MKKFLRNSLIEKRLEMSREEVNEKSVIISDKLLKAKDYLNCNDIYIYISIKNEVETKYIIEDSLKKGKKVAVPKIINKEVMKFYYIHSIQDVKKGYFDTYEPINIKSEAIPNKNSIFIVPGVAFDYNNNRLGYGGGFYDKYFNALTFKPKKIGIAYSFQIIEEVPTTKEDVKVDKLITE